MVSRFGFQRTSTQNMDDFFKTFSYKCCSYVKAPTFWSCSANESFVQEHQVATANETRALVPQSAETGDTIVCFVRTRQGLTLKPPTELGIVYVLRRVAKSPNRYRFLGPGVLVDQCSSGHIRLGCYKRKCSRCYLLDELGYYLSQNGWRDGRRSERFVLV